jgi:methionyl-tRNA formyltransferase
MSLRIALFGQAPLAVDCLDRLLEDGHEVVGVYAPPDTGRPDALATRAEERDLQLFRRQYFRKKTGEAIPRALESYRELGAELNVLASMTSFLPHEITDAPKHKSLCFHPSLLPRFRGGNALQWQIILGERESGVSIFVPDEGVDTGPVVVQKGGVAIECHDTTGTLFFDKLYPLGVEAIVEAVRAIDAGAAPLVTQDESRATFQGLVDDSVAAVNLEKSGEEIDRLVRGCDPQPGAFVRIRNAVVRLYNARFTPGTDAAPGTVTAIDDQGLHLALAGGVLCAGRVRADQGKEPAAAFAKRLGLVPGEVVASG